MAMECIDIPMVQHTSAAGRWTDSTGTGKNAGATAASIRDSTKVGSRAAKGTLSGRTGRPTKDNGN